ncbi:hypothetical protein JS756_17470 [Streptomyces actuosus]|uniref:Uncharacterized protein n=1 Tax=Streptomyces actuosus TaxID=1885 RepID=A0ABS2VRZ5_STRAS|nr:hypothetical protein [Streptomyces actuosus]MBN0045861.1 hypothetical protein [Streptomyces actuosus]
MRIETQLARHHAAELRTRADAHRLATGLRTPLNLRARVGRTLISAGMRLTAPVPAHAV